MSTTRFADAVAALLAAYTGAAAFAGVPVYDGPQPTAAVDPDFVIVGHDATTAADGSLTDTALAGIYLQQWVYSETREERGSINCLIVSQSGDTTDMPGRRARVTTLMAAAEDAVSAYVSATRLDFEGTSDGRWLTRQGMAGVAVMCAYRVSYVAPWD